MMRSRSAAVCVVAPLFSSFWMACRSSVTRRIRVVRSAMTGLSSPDYAKTRICPGPVLGYNIHTDFEKQFSSWIHLNTRMSRLRKHLGYLAALQLLPALESGEETLVGGQAVMEGVMMRSP